MEQAIAIFTLFLIIVICYHGMTDNLNDYSPLFYQELKKCNKVTNITIARAFVRGALIGIFADIFVKTKHGAFYNSLMWGLINASITSLNMN